MLTETYSPDKYPKLDNCDVIYIDKVKNIPKDYTGEMGVPVSILYKLSHDQFEITRLMQGCSGEDFYSKPYLNGKKVFVRLVVKKR